MSENLTLDSFTNQHNHLQNRFSDATNGCYSLRHRLRSVVLYQTIHLYLKRQRRWRNWNLRTGNSWIQFQNTHVKENVIWYRGSHFIQYRNTLRNSGYIKQDSIPVGCVVATCQPYAEGEDVSGWGGMCGWGRT